MLDVLKFYKKRFLIIITFLEKISLEVFCFGILDTKFRKIQL